MEGFGIIRYLRQAQGFERAGYAGVYMNIRIKNNLWQVGGMEFTDRSDAGIYLVRFGDEAALIDAGTGRAHQQLTKNIAECLEPHVQLVYLLLTHCHYDHAGGAKAVREEYGCKIVAHELDAVYMESGDDKVTAAVRYGAEFEPLEVDIKLQGEQTTISIGDGVVTAIHSPGHSPGSVAYATEIDGQLILFGQDIHGPIHSDYLSNERQYVASLTRLQKLHADILLEGHFGVIEPKQEVKAFIEQWRRPLGVSHYAILYAPPDWETTLRNGSDCWQPPDEEEETE